ncbi:hypothetical protein AOLI_G00242660, partial [Acnodon oligacanthus]
AGPGLGNTCLTCSLFSHVGRGIFSSVHFDKGDFLLEYRGELISKHECERRQNIHHGALKVFMFEFRYNGKLFCVDAALEGDSLGRLVNDDHVRPNSKMKTITVAGKPHLCLFATRSFTPGEEITYNYGDSEWPWRCKNIAETDALVSANSVLAKKNQMQPEELLPQVPRDATHKIKSEADVLVTTIPLLTEKDQMQPEELHPQFSREATPEICKHELVLATVSSMNKCIACVGPVASLKWIGLRCNGQ